MSWHFRAERGLIVAPAAKKGYEMTPPVEKERKTKKKKKKITRPKNIMIRGTKVLNINCTVRFVVPPPQLHACRPPLKHHLHVATRTEKEIDMNTQNKREQLGCVHKHVELRFFSNKNNNRNRNNNNL